MAEIEKVGEPLGKVKTPAGFSRNTIVINTATGRRSVEAFTLANIAIYRSIDGWRPMWTVSHVGTGFAALFHDSLPTAAKYARKLETATDWKRLSYRNGKLIGWTKKRQREIAMVILPERPDLAAKYPNLTVPA